MRRIFFPVLLFIASSVAASNGDFPDIDPFPHSQLYSSDSSEESEYLLGLGALQKIGGRWRHKASESLDGRLQRRTWQINEAYTADEAFEWFLKQLPEEARLLFECRGRSCGASAQWADRVFGERVLYGHDERQRYAAFRLQRDGQTWTLVLYASDRANRRHFLRLDVLEQTSTP